ncbi:MAG: protease modulator HflK [Verrucomicrobia bacterium]|nr:protease modulator HflK [Verrucomicrobiota bacterium]
MSKPANSPSLPPALLGIEAVGLLVLILVWKTFWLLPLLALVMLGAALLMARPATGVILAVISLAAWIITGSEWQPAHLLGPAWPVGAVLTGAALSFTGILAATGKKAWPPICRCLLHGVVLIHFISAGVLLAALYLQLPLHGWLAAALAGLCLLLTADTFFRLTAQLYTPRRHWPQMPQPGVFFFYPWLGGEWRACVPAKSAAEIEEHVSLKLADMWMWPVVRGSLPSLLATISLCLWASSCLHEIPASSQGVRQHLGAWQPQPLAPGLHLSLPWPLGAVEVVNTSLVREVVLGFRTDPGQPILWERAHYEGEQQSLVGGGDDFLSISVPILFRVSDPVLYLRGIAEPQSLLAQEAQRVLLTLALPLKAEQIMTEAREEMRALFRQRLQTALDALNSGIIITDVLLRDIHPPVSVAQTFQEVISAMEDKEAAIHEAESNNTDSLYNAKAYATATLTVAESVAQNRQAQVSGQVARFESRRAAWALQPNLYQWREGFRILDEALGATKKAIVDDSLQTRIPTQLDLRKVLNPDFTSSAAPAQQSLIPKPGKSLEAFDQEMEGYVRTGKGEIPAPNMAPPDTDNLLQNPNPMPKP